VNYSTVLGGQAVKLINEQPITNVMIIYQRFNLRAHTLTFAQDRLITYHLWQPNLQLQTAISGGA
jgi:hypothetical protein